MRYARNKIWWLVFFCIALAVVFLPSFAQAKSAVDVYFFWGDGCPHCANEEEFLKNIETEYGDTVQIHRYEVWYDEDNQKLLQQLATEHNTYVQGVPTTFIGDGIVVGFANADTTGVEIRQLIDIELNPETEITETTDDETIAIPILGAVNPKTYSLPILTFVIAAVDGFNPCAMWVLVLLIGMLIGMQNRKRLWILGTLFIFISGLVYFLFLAAWFNVFQFIGAVRWIQILVGAFALGAGVYYLRRFWKTRPGQCDVTNPEQKRKIIERMKNVVHKRSLLIAAAGIIVLASLVNIVELACSAGLPAIYTQVLSLSDLATWQHYLYLVFYIIIFMLDDMIIFAIAVTTFKSVVTSGKYSHIATLVGGVVILLLGFFLLFKPGWVMFG